MRISLSKDAGLFLKSEQRYLEQFNPQAARRRAEAIAGSTSPAGGLSGSRQPSCGLDGRRRFVSGDYVIDYRIIGRFLEVSHIRHGRQMPPDLDADEDPAG